MPSIGYKIYKTVIRQISCKFSVPWILKSCGHLYFVVAFHFISSAIKWLSLLSCQRTLVTCKVSNPKPLDWESSDWTTIPRHFHNTIMSSCLYIICLFPLLVYKVVWIIYLGFVILFDLWGNVLRATGCFTVRDQSVSNLAPIIAKFLLRKNHLHSTTARAHFQYCYLGYWADALQKLRRSINK